MSIRPDRRWLTKQYLVLATITVVVALAAGILHLILALAGDDVDLGLAAAIIWGVAGGLVVVMWVISVPVLILWFRNLDYEVEKERIIIRKGVLSKIQQNIPLGMVTDFRLHRSLYDRFLAIGSLQIQTAGQSVNATGYEGKLSGLAEWDTLHDDLRGRIRAQVEPPERTSPDSGTTAILDEVRAIRRILERAG